MSVLIKIDYSTVGFPKKAEETKSNLEKTILTSASEFYSEARLIDDKYLNSMNDRVIKIYFQPFFGSSYNVCAGGKENIFLAIPSSLGRLAGHSFHEFSHSDDYAKELIHYPLSQVEKVKCEIRAYRKTIGYLKKLPTRLFYSEVEKECFELLMQDKLKEYLGKASKLGLFIN
ncbi:MAG: hypothetical protein PHH54_03465 [Candidatus Nanoarchaeia archaeon]|nr:hypothetical protein [Candidatus Nanoarchaeia archaeon]MDD5741016.1 hypothetical protein [Candidatus Nanoarchaeia archaeon]